MQKNIMKTNANLKDGYFRLAKNIADFIYEEQVKLGYRKEVIRLYFPLDSLCNFFGEKMSEEKMQQVLSAMPEEIKDTLGDIKSNSRKGRFCIEVPEDGVAYVHEHMQDDGFLEELVALVSSHDCSKEAICALFKKYSENFTLQDMTDEDFDYSIHFEDRDSDDYYYCFHEEGCHIIYHRFTPEDYLELLD